MSVAVLVLAAGRGERLGADRSKAFLPLAGSPMLVHSLVAMNRATRVDLVVPVLAAADFEEFARIRPSPALLPKLGPPVAGGAQRQDSMAAGLAALAAGVTHVAVHDAARPLVRAEAVDRVVAAALRDGAAILAVPVRDTIKRVRDGRIVETPARSECFAAQTPQVFRRELLQEALAKAQLEGRVGTDEAQIVEALGISVTVVSGDADNFKVTDRDDLAAAERVLASRGSPGGAA